MRENMVYNAGLFQIRPYMIDRIQTIMAHNLTIHSCDYLFLGDSITEALDTSVFESFGTIVNAGISGLTTEVLLFLIDECVIKFAPKHVFLMIGTNDLGNTSMKSPRQIALNIKTIVEHINHNLETTITLISPLPCDESKHGVGIRSNAMLKLIFSEAKALLDHQVSYIDCFNLFTINGNTNKSLYVDGLHLNQLGYNKYIDVIKSFMNTLK